MGRIGRRLRGAGARGADKKAPTRRGIRARRGHGESSPDPTSFPGSLFFYFLRPTDPEMRCRDWQRIYHRTLPRGAADELLECRRHRSALSVPIRSIATTLRSYTGAPKPSARTNARRSGGQTGIRTRPGVAHRTIRAPCFVAPWWSGTEAHTSFQRGGLRT